jgi:hypothetical protein
MTSPICQDPLIGDYETVADRLGDTPQTVMQHYAHILKQRTQDRTGQWIVGHLS